MFWFTPFFKNSSISLGMVIVIFSSFSSFAGGEKRVIDETSQRKKVRLQEAPLTRKSETVVQGNVWVGPENLSDAQLNYLIGSVIEGRAERFLPQGEFALIDLTQIVGGNQRMTLFHLATVLGREEFVPIFGNTQLATARDKDGYTPLHVAVGVRQFRMATLIRQLSHTESQRDFEGKTALDHVIIRRDLEFLGRVYPELFPDKSLIRLNEKGEVLSGPPMLMHFSLAELDLMNRWNSLQSIDEQPGFNALFKNDYLRWKQFQNYLDPVQGNLTETAITYYLQQKKLLNKNVFDNQFVRVENISDKAGEGSTALFLIKVLPGLSLPGGGQTNEALPVYVLKASKNCLEEASKLQKINSEMFHQVRRVHSDTARVSLLEDVITYFDFQSRPHCYLLLHAARGKTFEEFVRETTQDKEVLEAYRQLGRTVGAFQYQHFKTKPVTLDEGGFLSLETYVHADIHSNNIVFHPFTKKVTFIDNSKFEVGSPHTDLFQLMEMVHEGYLEIVDSYATRLSSQEMMQEFFMAYLSQFPEGWHADIQQVYVTELITTYLPLWSK
jgi:hypothetical protein